MTWHWPAQGRLYLSPLGTNRKRRHKPTARKIHRATAFLLPGAAPGGNRWKAREDASPSRLILTVALLLHSQSPTGTHWSVSERSCARRAYVHRRRASSSSSFDLHLFLYKHRLHAQHLQAPTADSTT
ncbi:hypothetical protein BDW02DRAFT_77540 [Decorospora gaudefroyi]|uniref:Uncharacterized protein n=1 Tax=Decorospora gaudefroyi TaxID=184978 RepID=A0A6A5K0T1_9PLEO|nr:hypothetical protein BDW02DRAFT_77540 [Decorospora gaudefroyi]